MLSALRREQVALLPRDPDRGYVFWEITPEGLANARRHHDLADEVRLVGRIVTVAVEGDGYRLLSTVTSFDIHDNEGGRFFDFAGPDRLHRGEVGLQTDDGAFIALARSEVVKSPRRRPGDAEAHFVKVKLTDSGLVATPTDHTHPKGGFFPARPVPYVGSTTRPRKS